MARVAKGSTLTNPGDRQRRRPDALLRRPYYLGRAHREPLLGGRQPAFTGIEKRLPTGQLIVGSLGEDATTLAGVPVGDGAQRMFDQAGDALAHRQPDGSQ
jgi:hypothetical protein